MKKKIGLGLSLVLALGLVIGGTLALFSSSTATLDNTFTVGTGVSLELKEPSWDGSGFTGETTTPPSVLGKDTATNFSPSDVITKDPQVKNTSDKVSVFAAIEITYENTKENKPMSYAELATIATIDFNGTNWTIEHVGNKTIAYYKGALAPGDKTEAVFNNVTISKDVDETSPSFDISVKGYAVQESGAATDANIKAVINGEFSL